MVKVVADRREERGSAAARRLRRAGKVPGIVYGAGVAEPIPVAVDRHAFLAAVGQHVVAGQLVDLEVSGEVRTVKLQAVSRHPVRRDLAHLDFLALAASEAVEAQVPLEPGEGVRLAVSVLEVSGLPARIPASLTIGADLLANGVVTAGAVPLPEGIGIVGDPARIVATAEED
jgi:large subunit ribosomal protein L25